MKPISAKDDELEYFLCTRMSTILWTKTSNEAV